LRVLFFIPTFNDRAGLSELAGSLLNKYPQASMLVVDDGSSPAISLNLKTQHEIERAHLLRLDCNEGLGMATGIAIDFMLQNDFECLVRLDADGQHPEYEIDALKEKISLNMADVVWGERVNHSAMDSPRSMVGFFIKSFTAWLGAIIFRSNVKDWYTGFFAMNRAAAATAQVAFLERYCEVQLLCIFHAAKLRVHTHPIEQLERSHGKSSISWLGGMMIMLRSVLMMLLYALKMQPK
jgi:glycosyltransferase involved in cell wall biosynthesis